MHVSLLESFLVIVFVALTVTLIFRHLKIPIVLGYVLAGALVSPNLIGWQPGPGAELIKGFAEFGVVLLMFTIGLEFSLPKLLKLNNSVFILGALQVALSCIVATGVGLLLKIPLEAAIVISTIVAMSSTAIVIKQLLQQNELTTKHGSNAVGILLFQDLAVIPILILLPSLAHHTEHNILMVLGNSFVKGLFAFLVIVIAGKWLLKPLFRVTAATLVIELFTLAVLFVSVGAAWLTNYLGLSYALGAFLAGMMLAECEFKEKINAEIRPFRDLLLGLFFISIGMLVNVAVWPKTWEWILLLVVGLTLGKGLLVTMLCYVFKDNLKTAMRTGIILAQGSEFGFAVLTVARSYSLIPQPWSQTILAALLISFILSPILIRYNREITEWLCALFKKESDYNIA